MGARTLSALDGLVGAFGKSVVSICRIWSLSVSTTIWSMRWQARSVLSTQ